MDAILRDLQVSGVVVHHQRELCLSWPANGQVGCTPEDWGTVPFERIIPAPTKMSLDKQNRTVNISMNTGQANRSGNFPWSSYEYLFSGSLVQRV